MKKTKFMGGLSDFEGDVVDDGPMTYANLEKIDEETAMMVATPSNLTSDPAYPILGIIIPLFIIITIAILGIIVYRRNIALSTTTVAYSNLLNEGDDIALRELNPV